MSGSEGGPTADRLQELSDRRDIDDVLYRYAVALDSRDWDLLRSCFTEDAVADFLELGGVNEGVEAIVALVHGALSGLDSSHHLIGTPLASVDGDTATAVCYLQAQHVFQGADGGDHYLVGGRYEDRFVRTPAGWRIKHRTLYFSWAEGNPGVFPAGMERLKSAHA
jgi:ketosteroid isomerase-like protein